MDPKAILNKVKSHTPTILGSRQFATYAVLVPLVEKDDELHVLFEVRSHQMRRQPGETSFPGGKIDAKDSGEKEAAIRETVEELGVNEKDITGVHPLDYIVSPFGMIVYPYVGILDAASRLHPNPAEVEETFLVPLSFFKETKPSVHYVHLDLQPAEDFPYDLIIGGENYKWRARSLEELFYVYDDKVIWGLTAKIVTHFIELIFEK
ncbi:NUDIX hydrolase [Aquibacillus salsiterrae]|uniref:CoA pyrophosphatase n=1 Tax=Aquibacillus salsiterrae TaxID=2950439 RepID=A0A9X3WDF0_9BACI|nr:CoA pyrophosphatase [Aquibacillus salsiterrae]MDC3416968.1 CoA pyrophosphatase [Aquibacillus salsiterrae]